MILNTVIQNSIVNCFVCIFCRSLGKDQVQCACSYKPKNASAFQKPEWLPEHNAGKDYTPSYNIAPTDVTPVLLSSSRFRNVAESSRVLKPMMWGIIPPWHKVNNNNNYFILCHAYINLHIFHFVITKCYYFICVFIDVDLLCINHNLY